MQKTLLQIYKVFINALKGFDCLFTYRKVQYKANDIRVKHSLFCICISQGWFSSPLMFYLIYLSSCFYHFTLFLGDKMKTAHKGRSTDGDKQFCFLPNNNNVITFQFLLDSFEALEPLSSPNSTSYISLSSVSSSQGPILVPVQFNFPILRENSSIFLL